MLVAWLYFLELLPSSVVPELSVPVGGRTANLILSLNPLIVPRILFLFLFLFLEEKQ